MDGKTKLYVFAKKEVALIFIFMLLIAVTSFIFGVKVGRSYAFVDSGLKIEDKQKVDLLSGQEEKVNDVVEERKKDKGKKKEGITAGDFNQQLEERIKEELSGEGEKKRIKAETDKSEEVEMKQEASPVVAVLENQEKIEMQGSEPGPKSKKDQYSGKYTIQLGSHRTLKEAEEFSDGFRIRGYNPIINEVELSDRGIWYRVSIGVFETISDAKDFVKKENSLFQGQDYVFVRFD